MNCKNTKLYLIETLGLEDIEVDEIQDTDPLFGDGLGLDSVDALELGVALQKDHGIKLDPKDETTKLHFASIETLTKLIESESTSISNT